MPFFIRSIVYRAHLTPHPNWVYEMYDERLLVERVHKALSNYIHNLFSQTNVRHFINIQKLKLNPKISYSKSKFQPIQLPSRIGFPRTSPSLMPIA